MDSERDPSFELVDSSVCHVCRSLGDMSSPRGVLMDVPAEEQRDRGRYLYVYMHHPSVAALLRSARGCSVCAVLRDALKNFETTESEQATALTTASTRAESIMDAERSDDEVARRLAEFMKSKNPFEEIELGDIGKGRIVIEHFSCDELGLRGTTGKLDITVFVVNDDSLWGFLSGFQTSNDQFDPDLKHRPSRHLLSDPHIDLINHWRDTCKKDHASCRTTACDPQLPSRVLELDPNKEDGVRLIETHGRKKGTYACLSYCWGVLKTQTGQTNKSNLSNHLQGISLNNLPSTVADTIRLCHKLGFQFLWIDRLCIIQDDKEDWARESSKMCDIYSRSELTISTPICSESSQSFIKERLGGWFPEQSQFGIMEFPDEKSNLKSRFWMKSPRYKRDAWVFEENWTCFRSLPKDKSHWLGRGWTFQEWMLSPRVLHIDSMTIWDCFNGYANELNQRGLRETYLIRNPREFGKEIKWESMVEEYSKRGIAYAKDRLPGLAGLAERYRRETGYTYLAGMWLEEMPFSLLWQAWSHFSADGRELANQTTPSWSWAHCHGGVILLFDNQEFSGEASIESHYCRYEPPSSISTVVEAWIDVDGSLSVPRVVKGKEDNELLVGNQLWESADLGDAIKQDNVKLLLLASAKRKTLLGDVKLAALVLQRCGSNDVSPLCFRRVGIAKLHWSESEKPGEEPLWEKQVVRLV